MDGFAGVNVLSLETRRGAEMATLIRNYGGVPTTAPSMREDKQDISERLSAFAARVRTAPERQVLVCMTGIGTRLFLQDLQHYDPQVYAQLGAVQLLSRGTKPTQALKALGFTPLTAARPHTYREVQDSLLELPLKGQDVTILEYGEQTPAPLLAALSEEGAAAYPVPVYRCLPPVDQGPLQSAVRGVIAGGYQVLLLSSGTQAVHFLGCARELGLEQELRRALRGLVVASIGPACSEALGELRVPFDLEANPHKMGILVRHAAERSAGLLQRKRGVAV